MFCQERKDGWQFTKLGKSDFDRFGEPYSESYVKDTEYPNHRWASPSMFAMLADAMEKPFSHLPPNQNLSTATMLMQCMVHSIRPFKSRRVKGFEANKSWFHFGHGCCSWKALVPGRPDQTATPVTEKYPDLFTSDNGGLMVTTYPCVGSRNVRKENTGSSDCLLAGCYSRQHHHRQNGSG